jgi:hypothetical protein
MNELPVILRCARQIVLLAKALEMEILRMPVQPRPKDEKDLGWAAAVCGRITDLAAEIVNES